MAVTYAINFAPGFEELAGSILQRMGAEVIFSEEAFALVQLKDEAYGQEFRFAKSVIRVFDHVARFNNIELTLPNDFSATTGKTFSIRNFDAGRPAKMDETMRIGLIREISVKTGLRYSAFEPDVDFVVAKRRDGMSYFGLKLSMKGGVKPNKGELNPDIVNLLAELGDIKSGFRVLDAFAGYGGVSKEVTKSFNPLGVTAVEKDSQLVNRLKSEFGSKSKARVVASDVVNFLKGTELEFDLIIADPPWGEFENYGGDLSKLYFDFLTVAQKRLSGAGKLVIISSAKEVLEKVAEESGLTVEARLNVLISGKKVLVLKLAYGR